MTKLFSAHMTFSIRDALLPKLLSGELRVAEAANEVGTVKGER